MNTTTKLNSTLRVLNRALGARPKVDRPAGGSPTLLRAYFPNRIAPHEAALAVRRALGATCVTGGRYSTMMTEQAGDYGNPEVLRTPEGVTVRVDFGSTNSISPTLITLMAD